ncbi:hypothetical protein PB2503_12944 [Parvularcula bermudensis HTCC2503]|uniref:Uncharacterized protein n=1 Tax=Parvularcula bermudensis (strain ATCC BAA-594 / HTCC2503 / KCTC 12087) TaxID=314260 RepID=E0TG55_PARBH|nr:lipoprotein-releasing ABC transporter permease subunit [Parvularcula bermudensis]ADM10626.1 hypothetical protein PB2503_12944 [Parvularcula bermudensis HTCC2503]
MTAFAPTAGRARPFGRFEWSVARRYLGATRRGAGVSLITLIAFSGIMLSVATLIVVMSVFQGFRVNLLSQLLSVNGHVFVQNTESVDRAQQISRIEDLTFVKRATPVLRIETYLVGPRGQSAAQTIGITAEDLRAIEDIADGVRAGSLDTFGAGETGQREVAIGVGLSRLLGASVGDVISAITAGGAETPFGRTPTTQIQYRVGAIFSVGNSFFDQYYMYLPLEQAQRFARRPGEVTEIELRISDPLTPDLVLPAIQAAAGEAAYLSDWRDRNADLFNAVQAERGLMRILMLMIVAVATLLIVSGLVMLVKDKRGDIAVMRTMGATEGMVMRMFLLTGAIIGVLGALAGVGLGALIISNLSLIERALSAVFGFRLFNPNVYYLEEIPAIFEWREVLIVVSFALGMSFVFSAYPAWRASRVDPVEALRYE